ncbi:MAG TPA: ferrous iron transport protein B [Firmicutes bacterium]|nr:ferrous iron transport protein B [Bacillota bacterium]
MSGRPGCWGRCYRRRARHGRGAGDDGARGHGGGQSRLQPGQQRMVALVGNPNTGKSVVFQYLTGHYVEVSNYPGTTVEVSTGRRGDDLIVDTPGVYGISGLNDEERVTREAILRADVVVNVVDAAHLERDLFLTVQLCDLGVPMVVALNMVDEAQAAGRNPDAAVLERELGVPVIPTVAVRSRGLDRLYQRLSEAAAGRLDPLLVDKVRTIEGPRALAVLYLEGDDLAARRLGLAVCGEREEIWSRRRRRAEELAALAIEGTAQNRGVAEDHGTAGGGRAATGVTGSSLVWRNSLDRVLTYPPTGLLALVLLLAAAYWVVGVVVAGKVVGFTEDTVMRGYWEPAVRVVVGSFTSLDGVVGRLLAGEFGLLTMTVTYIVGLLLPLIVGFYLLMGLLEDSGYMPRVAVLFDRALSPLGLNGRAVIPFMLGFGCVTMAIVSTRVLATGRERRIAIVLLTLAVPCSAQLGVVAGMMGSLGWRAFVLYGVVILSVFAAVGTALNRLLPGQSSPLLMDLPPLRLPRWDNLLRKTAYRAATFLREAGPLFFYGAAALGILQITGGLAWLERLLAPLVTGWLGLPSEAAAAFVMGFVRRDFGAAGLFHLGLNPVQTLVAAVTITLFVPCVASVLIIARERGGLEAALLWVGNVVAAFAVGGVVARLAPLVVR